MKKTQNCAAAKLRVTNQVALQTKLKCTLTEQFFVVIHGRFITFLCIDIMIK